MADAFTDVLDEESVDTTATDGNEDQTTVTDTHTARAFADMGVRTETTMADGETSDKRYEDEETGDKADDVDPRGLFKQPHLNEIRYYAREGPYGPPLVEKPIDDIFKHGFDVVGDNTASERNAGKIENFLHEYVEYYKKAEKKSRRDGLAVLEFKFADGAESTSDPIPSSGGEFRGYKLWTIDNLSDTLSASTVADHTDYDRDQIYISTGEVNGGIAIVDDVSDPDHGEVLGYGISPRQDSEDVQTVSFLHADRCQHFVWREWVDGDVGNNVTGEHVGESVLTPVLQPLKGAQMGYWAMKNILYRYSAPLHAIEPPEGWGQDEWDDARSKLGDVSMMSNAMLPPGATLEVAEGVSEFDPEPIYSTLVESICAGTVFTKSILQGTQTGTVSGSETDVKGYFNEVQTIRTGRTERKFYEAIKLVSSNDQRTLPRVAGVDSYDIEWGPLFKLTDIERAEGAVSLITAVVSGIKQYVLTPDEARSIVEEEWADFDIDIDLEKLDEDDWDDLDRINLREAGRRPQEGGSDVRQNPQLQNGGGQPAGENRESSQPNRVSADDLDDEIVNEIADAVAEKLATGDE